MNPFDPAPASKPRTRTGTHAFPYLMTIAVATALITLLCAQKALRITHLAQPNITTPHKIMNSDVRAASKR